VKVSSLKLGRVLLGWRRIMKKFCTIHDRKLMMKKDLSAEKDRVR